MFYSENLFDFAHFFQVSIVGEATWALMAAAFPLETSSAGKRNNIAASVAYL
jgi:hypothetical protein